MVIDFNSIKKVLCKTVKMYERQISIINEDNIFVGIIICFE
jgi:hypothetical protein